MEKIDSKSFWSICGFPSSSPPPTHAPQLCVGGYGAPTPDLENRWGCLDLIRTSRFVLELHRHRTENFAVELVEAEMLILDMHTCSMADSFEREENA